MAEISNKTLATLLFFAIVVSLGGTLLSLNKLGQAGGAAQVSVTGAAVTGTGSVEITEVVAVNVIQAAINFGAVSVPQGSSSCILDSETGSVANTCTGAPVPSNANRFVFRNDGNVGEDIQVESDKSANAFINGTSPSVMLKVSNKEAGSGTVEVAAYAEVNVTPAKKFVASALKPDESTDEMWLDLKVTVPDNALPGARSMTLTFTACKDATPAALC